MAFTVTEIERGVEGDNNYVIQKGVSAGGSTGGDFTTGLGRVLFASIVQQGASTAANAAVINETFPLESSDVTVVTAANVTVYLKSVGRL